MTSPFQGVSSQQEAVALIDRIITGEVQILHRLEENLTDVQLAHQSLREQAAEVLEELDEKVEEVIDFYQDSAHSRIDMGNSSRDRSILPPHILRSVSKGEEAFAPFDVLVPEIRSFLSEHSELLKAQQLITVLLCVRERVLAGSISPDAVERDVDAIVKCVRNKVFVNTETTVFGDEVERFLSLPVFSTSILRLVQEKLQLN